MLRGELGEVVLIKPRKFMILRRIAFQGGGRLGLPHMEPMNKS